jgi:hypothetical protein
MNEDRRQLVPLGDTREFRVAAGLPDVRGWPVLGGDGVELGRVTELLVDRTAGRVRYLECTLVHAQPGGGRLHVPVGLAYLSEDRDAVEVPSVTTLTVRQLVVVDREQRMPEDEERLHRGFAEAGAPASQDEWYDERRLVARRRPEGERDSDFSYLVGVGGAMTDEDEAPELVGDLGAGQIRVPLMSEETEHQVAPEDQPGGAEAAMADEPAMRDELRRPDMP